MIRRLSLVVAAVATTAAAQWLDYPAPGIPRLPGCKPDLFKTLNQGSFQSGKQAL